MDEEALRNIMDEGLRQARKGRYRRREAEARALELLSAKQILSIVGVRRCGKSVLMKRLVRAALRESPNVLYLNLEQPFFNQYRGEVTNLERIYRFFRKGCVPGKRLYLFLDEIQFFPDWQVFIKALYERDEAKIVLTGSNSRLLSSELATLLSGRTIPLYLYPFSLREARTSLATYLVDGGFPEVVLRQGPRRLLAETYYQNILYQDVIPRFGIKHSLAMENLSFYLLSQAGREISYNTLKSLTRLDDKTVKEYTSYLQDANLLYILHKYDHSLKKLIGNKKKVYLVDPLFTQLSFKVSPDLGQLFENFIYMLLRRAGKELYFHQNGGECDFLIKEGPRITGAVQACDRLTPENIEREVAGLRSAMETFKLSRGCIVARSVEARAPGVEILTVNAFRKKFGIDSEKL